MSKIKKKLDINDFWLDCIKENNNNISSLPKNNNDSSKNLALKPLIRYNVKLKRNKKIYRHNSNLSYQNSKLIKTILQSEEKTKSIDEKKEQKTVQLYNSIYDRGMLFKEIKKKTISQINKQTINAEEKKLKKKMKLYRNKSIENKLNKNYVKLSMYERGIKFEQHKKMKLAQLFEENNKRLNIVYSFQPDISYKNLNHVFFSNNYCKEQTSNDSNKIFLSRLVKAREQEEIKKNWIENNLKDRTSNKMKYNKKLKKSLSQKDSLIYKKKLHQNLINLRCLPIDDEEKNNDINNEYFIN